MRLTAIAFRSILQQRLSAVPRIGFNRGVFRRAPAIALLAGFATAAACSLMAPSADELDGEWGKPTDAGAGSEPDAHEPVDADSQAEDAGNTSDAITACDPSAPFVTVSPVSELNEAGENQNARLTHDEQTIYFARGTPFDAGTSFDLFVASRQSLTDKFSKATPLPGPNTPDNEYDPTPTNDNLNLYFASDRAAGSGVWIATRENVVGTFGNMAFVASLNLGGSAFQPYVMPDGLVIYYADFSSSTPIYRATRTETSTFAPDPAPVLPVSVGYVFKPVVTPDELTIYFASNDLPGEGGIDIWLARRSLKTQSFGQPEHVVGVNTVKNDAPTWISDDGCRLYFDSDREGANAIYVATK